MHYEKSITYPELINILFLLSLAIDFILSTEILVASIMCFFSTRGIIGVNALVDNKLAKNRYRIKYKDRSKFLNIQ